ncbi:STM4504/CBY_0614 family protein [Psychrobacter sp. N25K4-3-2]|uniref:STM4504/CBY_0614 family protein n=1 Tax=unclassified Psychrobacter TaxID=196806 RepID=UPI00188DAF2A|nr:hypothetical protein [Psychrobacter sp. N25K4-3-2]MBF4490285.1 hypothetical protein [Psychrobacter sp. N25K4-3-2]
MAIVDLFHIRQKRIRGEYPDVYQYEELSDTLKVQIVHMWKETMGEDHSGGEWHTSSDNRRYLEACYNILCKELGVFELNKDDTYLGSTVSYLQNISKYFLTEKNIEKALSVVELMVRFTKIFADQYPHGINISDIIEELNQRFREHGVGYQYDNGQIIRIDSEFIHAEAVKPALQLLSNPMYKGAQEEFLKAHEHYRYGRYDSALTDCLKAFESTMKIILDKHGWEYDKNRDTASKLINCCIRNELIPKFWTDHFTSLNNMLTSSIPTPRNKLSGHGKGNKTVEVPEPLLQYVLHMTASTIVFLVKAEESLD